MMSGSAKTYAKGIEFLSIISDAIANGRGAEKRLTSTIRASAEAVLKERVTQDRVSLKDVTRSATNELIGRQQLSIEQERQFHRTAATVMRDMLLEHARARQSATASQSLEIEIDESDPTGGTDDYLALDEAITRLGTVDAKAADVIQMRFYAGLSVSETARILGLAVRDVKYTWEFARAWLSHTLIERSKTGGVRRPVTEVAHDEKTWQTAAKKQKATTVAVARREEQSKREKELRTALRAVMRGLPENYEECFQVLERLSQASGDEIAHALQPRLQERVKAMPQDSYADKQALASWLNGELRKLGLAIHCPRTGRPAILIADLKSSEQSGSRFRLEVRGADGRRIRTHSSQELPELILMIDEVRQEPLSKSSQPPRPPRK